VYSAAIPEVMENTGSPANADSTTHLSFSVLDGRSASSPRPRVGRLVSSRPLSSHSGMTSIVCIDDNPLVADALERRLSMEMDFRWLGWLNQSDDILARLVELAPDLVLLDIDMPGLDAFQLVEDACRRLPEVRVVMFTGYSRPDYLEEALRRGAWGYLSKSATTQGLLESLRRVVRGEVVLVDEVDDGSESSRQRRSQ
jgi:DNA-binding NarL/FixJ family response regulator